MLERVEKLKPAIVGALYNSPDVKIELSAKDFELISKLTNILVFFQEATKMLSHSDASISSIPVVTTIGQSLKTNRKTD